MVSAQSKAGSPGLCQESLITLGVWSGGHGRWGGRDCQGLLTWMSGRGPDAGHSYFLPSWSPWLMETTFVRQLLAQKSI